jgi:DNA-binding transcriptional ArsR family regulator
MSVTGKQLGLIFPCNCVSSSSDDYGDPWSAVAKHKILADGTKEEILNLVADEPRTISQLATALKLSPPSIHKHINEMTATELIRDSVEWEKLHPKERYYEPNFPVIDAAKCAEMEAVCDELSVSIADLFQAARQQFERAFQTTGLPEKGWNLNDLSQCLYARIQRKARRTLEERGAIPPAQPHRNGIAWSFWAESFNR